MKVYKQSLYNIIVEDGNLLISNSLYNKNIKYAKEDADLIKEILDFPNEVRGGRALELQNDLIKNEFLIDGGVDEVAYVNYLCNKYVFSDDVLHLSIIPTDACNFRCKYCYQSGEKHTMKQETVEAIKKYLRRSMKRFSGLYISWYGGEPLLNKNTVIDIMQYARMLCREQGIPLYGQMTTNGYNLTLDVFEELQKYHILSYMVTIDGNQDTHNMQRPHMTDSDSYTTILNNLRSIRDNCKRNNFRIGIRINISHNIMPYLNEYIDSMAKEFGNDVRFGMIWEWVKDWGGEKICSNYDLVMDSFEETNYQEYLNIITEKGLRLDKGQAMTRLGSEMCIASRKNGFLINYDGKIYKCAMALYDESLQDVNCIGKLESSGHMVINEYKNSLWVGQGKISDECHNCKFYPECMGLLCPLAAKLRDTFLCTHQLDKERPYLIINQEKFGEFN